MLIEVMGEESKMGEAGEKGIMHEKMNSRGRAPVLTWKGWPHVREDQV